MPASNQEKRKWTGLVCPACRFVFRIDSAHTGLGVICPGCDYLLSIPQEKPLAATPAPAQTNRLTEKQPPKKVTSKREAKPRKQTRFWPITAVAFSLCIIGTFLYFLLTAKDENIIVRQISTPETTSENIVTKPVIQSEDLSLDDDDLSSVIQKINLKAPLKSTLTEFIELFLNTHTVADLAPLIYNAEKNMPHVAEYYERVPHTNQANQSIDLDDAMYQKGNFLSVGFTQDGVKKAIVLVDTPEGYLVDWKSWVAWCEHPWDEIFEIRPTQEIEVRVFCSNAHYYNRYFKDEEKYQCVELYSPSSDKRLYGYLLRNDTLFRDMSYLSKKHNNEPFTATLKIKYPENPQADNQVYITRIVTDGWADIINE